MRRKFCETPRARIYITFRFRPLSERESESRRINIVETLLAQKDIIPIIIILVANNNIYLKHLLAFISYAMILSLSLTNRTLKLDRFAF